jgi:hypothetical protein
MITMPWRCARWHPLVWRWSHTRYQHPHRHNCLRRPTQRPPFIQCSMLSCQPRKQVHESVRRVSSTNRRTSKRFVSSLCLQVSGAWLNQTPWPERCGTGLAVARSTPVCTSYPQLELQSVSMNGSAASRKYRKQSRTQINRSSSIRTNAALA